MVIGRRRGLAVVIVTTTLRHLDHTDLHAVWESFVGRLYNPADVDVVIAHLSAIVGKRRADRQAEHGGGRSRREQRAQQRVRNVLQ